MPTLPLRIYFPLSKPILATVALFAAIGYWNDWWNSIMLVSDVNLYPVQYLLMKLIKRYQYDEKSAKLRLCGCGGHEARRILANWLPW